MSSEPNAPQMILPCALPELLSLCSDHTRWRVLDLLFDSEPLPPKDIGARLGILPTAALKHLKRLRAAGIVTQRPGRVYTLVQRWKVEADRSLDFGAVVIRLDALRPTPAG